VSTVTDALDQATTVRELAPSPGDRRLPSTMPVTILERMPGRQVIDLGELWRYRELLYFLTLRDIKVRYKQTILGAAWAVLQPLATMLVFGLFGTVSKRKKTRSPSGNFESGECACWA
jgi:hypothetical protein